MKLAKYLIVFLLLGISTVRAGSMKFFPSTGSLGMFCLYSGEVRVDTNSIPISAIDTRIFATNINLNFFTGLLSSGTFTHLGTVGSSLMAVAYPRQAYPSSSPYRYINRYASDAAMLLNVGDTAFFSYLFASTGLNTAGNLDLYYITGENFDDSNMQSGIVNGIADVLNDVNSGSYVFLPRPCIVDSDPPLFTGYASGTSYNADTDSGFYFTIYDFTGNNIVGYNSTQHYRFQAGTPDTGNLANYVPAPLYSGVDNQEGVNSGTIIVYLSGISALVTGNLLAPTMLTLTGLDCTLAYDGPGYPLTWNQRVRGYKCFVPFSSITFETSQIVQVVISGADYANLDGAAHTGALTFTFSVNLTVFDIKAYPGSRPGGDFSNINTLKFYNSGKVLIASGLVTTNASGLGTLPLSLPTDTYYAIFKGQSHLASYLSGVTVTGGSTITLDFTTGANLFNTQNQSISQDDGYQRQIAGDLKSIDNKYDYTVNGNDIAILVMSGFIDSGIGVLDPKNLNADIAINVSDISVIGVNFQLKDPFHSTYSGEKFTF